MSDSEEFSWNDESVIIEQVDAVAAYTNPKGDLVIRQQGYMGENDSVIVIPRSRVAELVSAISREAGLGELKRVV